ncbi:MAG TPA: spermidine/putrescine ABC transporter substrate-binding protein [bacterium]|nr:spermidine/putrescine ABC transporter substrate-binding protein [bacterium]
MRRSVIFIAILCVFALLVLYFFFHSPSKTDRKEQELAILTWEDYTDRQMVADFERETGIAVTVVEIKTSSEQVARLQDEPAAFDLVVVDESVLEYVLNAKLTRPFDLSKIPNITDITSRFGTRLPMAVPQFWGTAGYIIDTRQVPADTDSVEMLWDPRYRDRIRLLDDAPDAIVPLLHRARLSINGTASAEQENAIIRYAEELRENGVSFGDTFDNIAKVMDGTVWIAQTYSGDYLYKARDLPHLRFVLPREGFRLWADYFVLSKSARNLEAAHRFISFRLRPEVAARASSTFFYPCAVKGSEKLLRPELRENSVMFPAISTLERGERYERNKDPIPLHQKLFNLMKK